MKKYLLAVKASSEITVNHDYYAVIIFKTPIIYASTGN